MSQRIGFVGWADGHKVFFNGDVFYAQIGNKAFAINWDKIEDNRKKLL